MSCSATGGERPHPSDREHGRDRLLYLHDRSGCLVWQQRFRLIYSATVGRVLTVYPRNAICRAVACREMADGGVLFSGVFEILNRRHRVSDPDPDSGTFKLQDDDRTVRVVLEPEFLAAYFAQLDERDIPELATTPQDAQDRLRARYLAIWIEEIFESDLQESLTEIRLTRAADGRISLTERRGAQRKPFPWTHAEPGYWSPDRPDV